MCPLIRYWRGKGIRVVMYIDDGIVAVEGVLKSRADSTTKKYLGAFQRWKQ